MTKLYKKWNSVTEELGEIFHVLPVSRIKVYISNDVGGGERTPPHTHKHMHMHTNAHVRTHTHTHAHARAHSHTHTHTHRKKLQMVLNHNISYKQ